MFFGFFLPWIHVQVRQVFGHVSGYQAGYNVGAIGWTVFILGFLVALAVFVTPKGFLYKISMLQLFMTLLGILLVINLLIQAGNRMGPGLLVCLLGFIGAGMGSLAKFKKLAA